MLIDSLGGQAPRKGLRWDDMTDEPTRRMLERQPIPAANSGPQPIGPEPGFAIVPERQSTRPEAFSEREGPTLASPSSTSVPATVTLDQRLTQVSDQVAQMETNLETIWERLDRLTEVVNAEQTRGRAARVGRYMLWGALIAAMATFWMLLRLRFGIR